MARANLNQTNFTAGEVSPSIYGRVDLTKYANGASRIRNLVVRPQGGVTRRPGTKYVAVNDGEAIIPFSFNAQQSYIITIGTNLLVFKDDALHQTIVGHAYNTEDLPSLRWVQSGDTLFIVHGSYPVYTLTRDGGEVFTLAEYEFEDGPYLPDEPVPIYLTDYEHTGVVEATTGAGPFVVGDVGDYVEYRKDGLFFLALITAYNSATSVDVDVLDTVMTDFDEKIRIKAAVTKIVAVEDTIPIARPGGYNVAQKRHILPSSTLGASAAGAGATITASFAGTFTRQDVGKYIRMTAGAHAGVWFKITAFTSGTSVTANALTTVAYTFPTQILELTSEARTVVATVKSGGPVDPLTGEDYFLSYSYFVSGDEALEMVDRHIRFNFGGTQVWGRITGLNGANRDALDIELEDNLPRNSNDQDRLFADGVPDSWRLGAWYGEHVGGNSDFYGTGYPSTVCFHEQRLTFAGSYGEPQTVWMSRSNDYGNMAPTERDSSVLDDNAITYTIVSRQVNTIRWMESGPVLLIGTVGGEWQVKAASSIAAPLTPSNISVTPQSNIGATEHSFGIRVNGAVLFLDRSGRKLRHMQYNFELDQHVSRDLNVLADHILVESGVRASRFVYAQNPHSLFWVLDTGGKLSCMTYEPDQEVYAWTRHTIGGNSVSVTNMAVIPNSTGTQDIVYLIVDRTVNSVTTTYLERFEEWFEPTSDSDTTGQKFLDCGIRYSGAAVTTITGLSHLNGDTVRVFGNGKDLGTKVVTANQITGLSEAVTTAWIGYQSNAVLGVLRPEGGSPAGTSQGKTKRIHKMAIRLHNSQAFQVGETEATVVDYSMRGETGFEDVVYTLHNGDKIINLDQGWGTDGTYFIVQNQAYNLGITSLMPLMNVNE
jgi:hypothetical protein